MLAVEVLILAVLSIIFIQDVVSRSVYWVLFPVLGGLFIILRLVMHQDALAIGLTALINTGFVLVQLLLVSAYFSIKNRRLVNITANLLGWGDVLFLLCMAFYLSVFNFLFFYTVSLLAILLFWLIWQLFREEKSRQIPLAGLQALLLAACLISDWWVIHFHLISDNWLLHFISR